MTTGILQGCGHVAELCQPGYADSAHIKARRVPHDNDGKYMTP